MAARETTASPTNALAAGDTVAETGLSATGTSTAATDAAADAATGNVLRPGELPILAALSENVREPVPKEVVALAEKVTQGCENDYEKSLAIYLWLTENIEYDWVEWQRLVAGDGHQRKHDPLSVLRRGTTVCAGYSWLFTAMAQSVGLDSSYITGYTRGYRGTMDEELVDAVMHAWNGVAIDNTWYLLDATWGARQSGELLEDYAARQAYYFMTPADQMVFDHLPEHDYWQLVADPVASEEFRELPNLKPAFFRNGLLLGNQFSSAIHAARNEEARLTLFVPDNVRVTARVTRDGEPVENAAEVVAVFDEQLDVVLNLSEDGEYILRVYAGAYADRMLECALDYAVNVSDAAEIPAP